MTYWKRYLKPVSVDEALGLLASASGKARVIAGGTDLLLDLRQGRVAPVDDLVDVSGIPEMQAIRLDANAVFLGAAVTHREIVTSPILNAHALALVQACRLIGGPQVREVATIGGNVAHALPAADGAVALLALGGEGWLADATGRRWLPVESLFRSPGVPAYDRSREILVGFRFPLRSAGEGSAFHRVMRPQGVAIAVLNGAAWLRLGRESTVMDARLVLAPSGPTPARSLRAEAVLRGRHLDVAAIAEATYAALDEAKLRASAHRATREYRVMLADVIVRHVLLGAQADAIRDRSPVPR